MPPGGLVLRQSTEIHATDDPLVARTLQFIEANCDRPVRVGELVERMGVSRRTLEQRFRASVGRGVAEEMIRLRLNRAMGRLERLDEPIKAVAYASGFKSVNYFGKVFLRDIGITPSEFRNQRMRSGDDGTGDVRPTSLSSRKAGSQRFP